MNGYLLPMQRKASGLQSTVATIFSVPSLKNRRRAMSNEKARVGDRIKIIKLDDPYVKDYPGRTGTVTDIDSMGQLHGTWGSLAVIPEIDLFEIIKHA